MSVSVLVKSLGYKSHKGGKNAQGMKAIKAHLKYIQTRKNEQEEKAYRELFGKEGKVERGEFYESLKEQPERGVIAHKFVLSMERMDFENKEIDYKELTKDIMSAYEAKIGKELNWIACFHDKDKNPHVHLVIAGRDSKDREIVFMPQQLKQLKSIAEKECERHAERNKERESEKEFDLIKQIEKEQQIQPPENEHTLSRDLENSKQKERKREVDYDV